MRLPKPKSVSFLARIIKQYICLTAYFKIKRSCKTQKMKDFFTIKEATHKLEHYCAYQDRCHEEVVQKLRTMKMDADEIDRIIVQLITDNFLNEERFACSYARGKHLIKHWGKIRITNELKFRKISATLIKIALKEINDSDYFGMFDELADKHWETISQRNVMKKRKKFCDYFLRKGWENELIYQKVKELERL